MSPITIDITKGINLAIADSLNNLLTDSQLVRVSGNHYQLTFTPRDQLVAEFVTETIANYGVKK